MNYKKQVDDFIKYSELKELVKILKQGSDVYESKVNTRLIEQNRIFQTYTKKAYEIAAESLKASCNVLSIEQKKESFSISRLVKIV